MIALPPVAAGEVGRKGFEFTIKGELREKEPGTGSSGAHGGGAPGGGDSGPNDVSSLPAPAGEPAPRPAATYPASNPPNPRPAQEPIFTVAPQPFFRKYSFDDRRSDVPLDSPAGQFLMKNVYAGGPNCKVLISGVLSSLLNNVPFTPVTINEPSSSLKVPAPVISQTSQTLLTIASPNVTNLARVIVNTILSLPFGF